MNYLPTPRFEKVKVRLGILAALPFASVGGSIFSGLMGQQQNAANLAMAQSQFNRQMQLAREQFELQKGIANKQQELATAGSQDARGNKTRYIPGVGWVSEPTDATRNLLARSDAEESARLGPDAARTRRGKEANETSRSNEGALANAYLRQLMSKSGEVTPDQMQSRIADVMLSDIQERGNEAKNAIGLQSLRSGTSSNLADDIDKLTTGGVRTALARARMDAPTAARENNEGVRGALLNAYNLMGSRAANVEDAPFQPTNVDSTSTGLLNRSMTLGPYGLSGASGAIGKGAGDASTMMGRGFDALSGAFGQNRKNQFDYGAMFGGLGEAVENFMRRRNQTSTGTNPDGSTF